MRCIMCHGHATFDHTVFKGTQAVKVRLCDPCSHKVDVQGHIAKIKAAPDHQAKTAAVDELLQAIGK